MHLLVIIKTCVVSTKSFWCGSFVLCNMEINNGEK